MHRFTPYLLLTALAGGCAFSRSPGTLTPDIAPKAVPGEREAIPAEGPLEQVLIVRSSERVAALKSLGGECAAYGSVLETSLQAGRVTVRDYMWRVGGRLVSGEARPDGAIVIARHIDPLNVGVRTIDDMVRTLEHEAAHVAFRIPNGRDADDASTLVRTCSHGTGSSSPSIQASTQYKY